MAEQERDSDGRFAGGVSSGRSTGRITAKLYAAHAGNEAHAWAKDRRS